MGSRRRNSDNLFDDEFEELNDDFGVLESETVCKRKSKPNVKPVHSDNWTIVDAFNVINEHLPKSQLGKDLFVSCAEPFSYLSSELGFSAVQCVIIAMLVETGKPMSFRQIGKILGLSRLSVMSHSNEMEDLFRKRWLVHRGAQEDDGMYEGYGLARGVVTAIRENRVFVPENLECENTQEFVERVATRISCNRNLNDYVFSDEKVWLQEIVNTNKNLPVCQVALDLGDTDSMSLLMLVIADYCQFSGQDNEGIDLEDVQMVYTREMPHIYHRIVSQMQNGTHQLFRAGLIEHKCEVGMADVTTYVATSRLKNEVLADFTPSGNANKQVPHMNGLKKCKDITPKALFYNKREEVEVFRLKSILSQEQLPLIKQRLADKGMRTGICILMYGGPGTGKTATAYELARQTGRDIIQVEVTDFKDKWVGESESKLKAIFDKYRTLCRNSETTPILFLNEGDAILSKRSTNVERSVDQMANALQNILLEEMENLEGIMIVTTNLTANLDKAFERRFIFKLQFDKPEKEVKARIWQSMIGELSDDDSMALAGMFDISGGEIENIARKATMEYVLTGNVPNFDMVVEFAKGEKLNHTARPVVGFNINQ